MLLSDLMKTDCHRISKTEHFMKIYDSWEKVAEMNLIEWLVLDKT